MGIERSIAVKRLKFKSRKAAGVEIEQPEFFFDWANLPVAHGYGLAAFAFHIEFERRRWQRRGTVISEDVFARHLDLGSDELRISNFYGGLQILNDIPPLRNVGLSDEGLLYADTSADGISKEEVFDTLRPGARDQVRQLAERAIFLQALEVRGRPESPLASKVPVEWGSFLAGIVWDRGRALMILDGAKLYDVEVRVAPRLRPDDLPRQAPKQDSAPLSPRRLAILQAAAELWPRGCPPHMTKKERDREIIAQLQKKGLAVPSPKTIKRAFDSKQDKT